MGFLIFMGMIAFCLFGYSIGLIHGADQVLTEFKKKKKDEED